MAALAELCPIKELPLISTCISTGDFQVCCVGLSDIASFPLCDVGSPLIYCVLFLSPSTEKGYFSVFLSKTHSSLEIHCGQYMLSVGNDSICLHWITTAAIAHHWPRKYVQELGIRNSNLVLKVCK